MALLNEVLGVAARYQQLLTRKFGIVGGAPSPQLTPELSPEYHIEGQAEDRILLGELRCSAVIQVPANAGQKSHAHLFNPAGSNTLLVLEGLRVQCGTAAITSFYAGLRQGTVFPLAPAGITSRDTRRKVNAVGDPTAGVAVVKGDNSGGALLNAASLFIFACTTAQELREYNEPVVITPGWYLEVVNNTVNLAMWLSLAWREVPMANGEQGPF